MGLWQSWISRWTPATTPVAATAPETTAFLVERTRDLVVFLRTDGTIEAVNAAFSRQLGWADEFCLDRDLPFLARDPASCDALQSLSTLTVSDWEGPLELHDPRGQPIFLHGVFRRVYNPDREAVGGVLLLYDLRDGARTADDREDQLTSLANRRWVLDLLEAEFQRFVRYGGHVAVLWLRLGGPEVDDEVLKKAGSVLKAGVRKSDFCGRIGERDFLVVLPETPPERAGLVAGKLRRLLLAIPFEDDADPLAEGLGVGIGHLEDSDASTEVFLARLLSGLGA